jgi:hypothetical protein
LPGLESDVEKRAVASLWPPWITVTGSCCYAEAVQVDDQPVEDLGDRLRRRIFVRDVRKS